MTYLLLFFILLLLLAVLLWPVHEQKKLCLWVMSLFFIAAFGIYGFVGAPQIVPLLEAHQQRIKNIKAALIENSEAVKTDPKNLPAWIALGQAFIENGQWEAAANAFRQAVLLSNGDPKFIMAYAKALILADGGMVGNDAQKSLKMVLAQEPAHEEARYYLAVSLLQEGKTEKAMKAMKELYHSLPDDSPLRATINAQIGK